MRLPNKVKPHSRGKQRPGGNKNLGPATEPASSPPGSPPRTPDASGYKEEDWAMVVQKKKLRGKRNMPTSSEAISSTMNNGVETEVSGNSLPDSHPLEPIPEDVYMDEPLPQDGDPFKEVIQEEEQTNAAYNGMEVMAQGEELLKVQEEERKASTTEEGDLEEKETPQEPTDSHNGMNQEQEEDKEELPPCQDSEVGSPTRHRSIPVPVVVTRTPTRPEAPSKEDLQRNHIVLEEVSKDRESDSSSGSSSESSSDSDSETSSMEEEDPDIRGEPPTITYPLLSTNPSRGEDVIIGESSPSPQPKERGRRKLELRVTKTIKKYKKMQNQWSKFFKKQIEDSNREAHTIMGKQLEEKVLQSTKAMCQLVKKSTEEIAKQNQKIINSNKNIINLFYQDKERQQEALSSANFGTYMSLTSSLVTMEYLDRSKIYTPGPEVLTPKEYEERQGQLLQTPPIRVTGTRSEEDMMEARHKLRRERARQETMMKKEGHSIPHTSIVTLAEEAQASNSNGHLEEEVQVVGEVNGGQKRGSSGVGQDPAPPTDKQKPRVPQPGAKNHSTPQKKEAGGPKEGKLTSKVQPFEGTTKGQTPVIQKMKLPKIPKINQERKAEGGPALNQPIIPPDFTVPPPLHKTGPPKAPPRKSPYGHFKKGGQGVPTQGVMKHRNFHTGSYSDPLTQSESGSETGGSKMRKAVSATDSVRCTHCEMTKPWIPYLIDHHKMCHEQDGIPFKVERSNFYDDKSYERWLKLRARQLENTK